MTFIEGEVYFDRKQDLAMREKLAKEKKDLIEREKKMPGVTQPTLPQPPTIPTDDDGDGHLHKKN
jgi:hypothetical protein